MGQRGQGMEFSALFSATASPKGPSTNILKTLGFYIRGLRPEAGNAGSRGDLSHILSFVAHTCARLSPLQKLDLLKKREREMYMYIYIYII